MNPHPRGSSHAALAALLTTTMLRSLPVRRPPPSSVVHPGRTRRRSISRGSGIRVPLSVSYLPSPHPSPLTRATCRFPSTKACILVTWEAWSIMDCRSSSSPYRPDCERAHKHPKGHLRYLLPSLLSSLHQLGPIAFFYITEASVALRQRVRCAARTLEYAGFALCALEESGAAWLLGARVAGTRRLSAVCSHAGI